MTSDEARVWREPWAYQAPAFWITETLAHVGNRNVSCHLLKTAAGMVLIDTAFAQTTYLLTESLRQIGVDPAEIVMILHTHGHVDHCGATRRMKELSGAVIALGEQDVQTVEQGTPMTCAEYLYGINDFETFTVDRPLRHLDEIDLGDTTVLCHHTPGHSPGVMTYTFEVEADGESHSAGVFGGPGLWTLQDAHREEQGYAGNRKDFARTLDYLKGLEIDVWLGAHPGQNDTFGKHERLMAGEMPNPFIDPAGWREFISRIESNFVRLTD